MRKTQRCIDMILLGNIAKMWFGTEKMWLETEKKYMALQLGIPQNVHSIILLRNSNGIAVPAFFLCMSI